MKKEMTLILTLCLFLSGALSYAHGAGNTEQKGDGRPIELEVEVGDDDKITFRVADSFEITGPFQADSGCEFTVIRQDCPE